MLDLREHAPSDPGSRGCLADGDRGGWPERFLRQELPSLTVSYVQLHQSRHQEEGEGVEVRPPDMPGAH